MLNITINPDISPKLTLYSTLIIFHHLKNIIIEKKRAISEKKKERKELCITASRLYKNITIKEQWN